MLLPRNKHIDFDGVGIRKDGEMARRKAIKRDRVVTRSEFDNCNFGKRITRRQFTQIDCSEETLASIDNV